MTNGRTGAKGRRGMPPKKVGNGTKTSKDHIGKKIRNKVNLFSVRAGLDIPFLFIILVLVSIGLVMLFSSSYAYTIITTETVSILSNVRQYLLYWVLQV